MAMTPIKTPFKTKMRPGQEFGRTIVRTTGIAAKSRNVNILEWTYVRQAAPASVGPSNPATLIVQSDQAGSYDGAADGYKSLLKFAEPIALDGNFIINVPLSGSVEASFEENDSVDSVLARCTARFRTITASFDLATMTWNGLAGLTIGSTYTQIIASGNYVPISDFTERTGDSEMGAGGGSLIIPMVALAASPVYGLLVDLKPDLIGSSISMTGILGEGEMVMPTSPTAFIY